MGIPETDTPAVMVDNPIPKMVRFPLAVAMTSLLKDEGTGAQDRATVAVIEPLISQDRFTPREFVDTVNNVRAHERELTELKLPKIEFFDKRPSIRDELFTPFYQETLGNHLRYAEALAATNMDGVDTKEQEYIADYLRQANHGNRFQVVKPQAEPVLPVQAAQVMAEAFRSKKYQEARDYADITGDLTSKHDALMHVVRSFAEQSTRNRPLTDSGLEDDGTRNFLRHWQFNAEAIPLIPPLLRGAVQDASLRLGAGSNGTPQGNMQVAEQRTGRPAMPLAEH